jgi:hypothetical protein
MPFPLGQGTHGFDGLLKDGRRVEDLLPQSNPSLCDSRDVEQVVDEMGKRLHLSIDDAFRLFGMLLRARFLDA